jgi:predicted AlkP superfamily pyrophosphatase or phosphodiesterase
MRLTTLVLCLASNLIGYCQNKNITPLKKPKLVVGIVVDQMRYDYLYRFYDRYSNNGLKRLMKEGFNCRNNHYHYASTITGPGHAHVYTGSIPAISGIVGNTWYDKVLDKTMYVVADSTVKVVGDGSEAAGKMSPRNLKVSTITDQLAISSQFTSKIVGVAIKDRGAILPAGHTGDAYWYDATKGNWISSDYYKKQLPQWVNDFNSLQLPKSYTTQSWEPLFPLSQYTETEEDEQPYEAAISGETKAVFPHKITMGSIAQSYFGNELTTKFALEALKAEKLGQGKSTDFLAISFSSPDYAGHSFGAQSKEIEDIYLRFDKNIEEILNQLDKTLGKGTYTVFLTADHGVAEIPAFLKKHNIPTGLFLGSELKNIAEKVLVEKYGEARYFLEEDNYQLYADHSTLTKKNLTIAQLTETLKSKLVKLDGIFNVINLEEAASANISDFYKAKLTNLYNPKRSGEIMILLEPAWFSGYTKGTTHGTMYAYDTHVPLLFFGWGVNSGESVKPTYISDIAPTLAMILKILEPNGSVGTPIAELIKK